VNTNTTVKLILKRVNTCFIEYIEYIINKKVLTRLNISLLTVVFDGHKVS
jgi:hypothetical protein